MRKVIALALILAGVGVIALTQVHHPDPGTAVIIHHQKDEVARIEKGVTLHECGDALIRVPSWGKYVMPIQHGASEKVLDSGVVGHFPHTGPLGIGNYALTAHVVTHGEPFAQLPSLAKGALVQIEKCGKTFTFKVTKKYTVYYTNVAVLNYKPKTLTLITCASKVVHTDYRTVVVGRLVRS